MGNPATAGEQHAQDIDRATLDQWAAPYRGWHHWPDHVVPAKPRIPGHEPFANTDVPCVYQLQGDGHHVVAALHRGVGEGDAEPSPVPAAPHQLRVGPPVDFRKGIHRARGRLLEVGLPLIVPHHVARGHSAQRVLDGVVGVRRAGRVQAGHGIEHVLGPLAPGAPCMRPDFADEGGPISGIFPEVLPDLPGIVVVPAMRHREERLHAHPPGAGVAVVELELEPVRRGLVPHPIIGGLIEPAGVDDHGVAILMGRGA